MSLDTINITLSSAGAFVTPITIGMTTPGPKGDKGDKGDPGSGEGGGGTGPAGPVGPQGPKGDNGATGAVGPRGDTGLTGLKGDSGNAGATGVGGVTGATGPKGIQGEKGERGDTGATGNTGSAGATVLSGLLDVDFTTPPSNTNVLAYDSASAKWKPAAAGSGGSLNPIATFTYTGNAVVTPTAVDTTTDTFTAAAHGLINGNIIFPAWSNVDTNAKTYPAGMVQGNYYVVGVTSNTFQISLTSGGSAVDITSNANITNMHFQKAAISSFVITGLGTLVKCNVRALILSNMDNTNYGYEIRPNEWVTNGDLQPNQLGGGNYNIGKIGSRGSVLALDVDGSMKIKSIKALYVANYYTGTAVSGSESRFGAQMISANYPFTALYVGFYASLSAQYIGNGTKVEVYAA